MPGRCWGDRCGSCERLLLLLGKLRLTGPADPESRRHLAAHVLAKLVNRIGLAADGAPRGGIAPHHSCPSARRERRRLYSSLLTLVTAPLPDCSECLPAVLTVWLPCGAYSSAVTVMVG